MTSNWYYRNEIKRITRDWVEVNCKITAREKELLKLIYDRKLVRRDMLEVISPSYRVLGKNRTRLINRSIKKMYLNMCLDKVHEPQEFMKGNLPATLAVDKAGSIILDKAYKPRLKKIEKKIRGEKYLFRQLPSNYKHINGVNQLEVETILFCEENKMELTEWTLEKAIEVYYGRDRVNLIPDVLMKLEALYEPVNAFYAYIEFDTSSENIRYKEPPIIKDKVIKYKKYKLSKIWEKDFNQFPVVLLVTTEERRAEFFNKICRENGLVGLCIFYKNYKNFLERWTKTV